VRGTTIVLIDNNRHRHVRRRSAAPGLSLRSACGAIELHP
jgi:hypothetical protein